VPGTYQVDSDCTGALFDQNAMKTSDIVVLEGGNEFFLISTLTGRIITAVNRKLEREE
jgi:hypothetical protein